VALDFIDCPDRRLARAASDLAEREVADPGTHVTVILPRRSYSPLLGRLLHDRTADKIAAAVSRVPRSAATIVPYDVPTRVAVLQARQAEARAAARAAAAAVAKQGKAAKGKAGGRSEAVLADPTKLVEGRDTAAEQAASAQELSREADVAGFHAIPRQNGKAAASGTTASGSTRPGSTRPGIAAIGAVTGGKVVVEGKIRVVEIRPVERNSVLAVEINDSTGNLTAMFYGRSHIPSLICGARVRFSGSVGIRGGQPVMINPAYELLSVGE
jgi:hypothetical protein